MPKRFRLTIRARLTISYAALFAASGGVLILGINLFMRYWPTWAIPAATQLPASELQLELSLPSFPAAPAAPVLSQQELLELGYTLTDGHYVQRTEGFSTLEIQSTGDIFSTLLGASLIALVVIVLLGAVAAWFLSGRMLAPLHTINEAARRASPSRLDQRVGLTGPRDELTELSETLDEMLDRLEGAYSAQQLFAANASHELRTPLATEKALIDMVLDGPEPSAEELRGVVTRLREVNGRNIELVNALLLLTRSRVARADREDRPVSEPFDAAPLVEAVLAEALPAAAARGMAVDSSVESVWLVADQTLLSQLTENLVQNAIRHGDADAGIRVRLLADADTAVLRVTNRAHGIPSEVLARLHEPFVRAGGRVRAGQGSGLGLAIARAIAESTGGELRLEQSAAGEFVAEARIPRGDAAGVPAAGS